MNPADDSLSQTRKKTSKLGCLTGFLGGWFGFVAGLLAANHICMYLFNSFLDGSWPEPVLALGAALVYFVAVLLGSIILGAAFCALGAASRRWTIDHKARIDSEDLYSEGQIGKQWHPFITRRAQGVLAYCIGAILGGGLVCGVGSIFLNGSISGQYKLLGTDIGYIVLVIWANYLLLGIPLGAIVGAFLGHKLVRNIGRWRMASPMPTGPFGGISFRQAMVSGAAWTVVGIFPLAAFVAVIDSFPVPFFGYRRGVNGVLPAMGGVLLYGVFGGFILLSAVGAIGGLLARLTSRGSQLVFLPHCLLAAILIDVAAVLLMAGWGPIGPPVSRLWPW